MKRGFTLIEMIGSIIILAMIALVAFPAVLNLITNSQGKIDESMKESIIGAAREYVEDHVNCYPRIGTIPPECENIPHIEDERLTTELLINNGYLTEKNIHNQTEMKNDVVKVSLSVDKNDRNQAMRYEYTYIEK